MNNTYIVLIYLSYLSSVVCLRLPRCYIHGAPEQRDGIQVRWQTNKRTGKPERAYYYVSDEGEVRIPQFSRKRAFTYNTLVAAQKHGQYTPPDILLERLKEVNRSHNFAYVKAIFLDIYRWFSFRKQEFLKDELFHKIRHVVRKKHFFFGRVYSRVLRRLFKFSNCYEDQQNLSLLDFFVAWDTGGLDKHLYSLEHIMNGHFNAVPEPWVFDRILSLYEHVDSMEVLQSIFQGVHYSQHKFAKDSRSCLLKLLNSTAARSLYGFMKRAKRVHTVLQIHELTRVKFQEVDELDAIKKGFSETLDEYAMRMGNIVTRAFEHVFKLLQMIEKVDEERESFDENGIGFERNALNRDEMLSINLMAKMRLYEEHRDVELVVRGAFEIVQFLKEKLEQYSNVGKRTAFISHFKSSVLLPYMTVLMRATTHAYDTLVKMKAMHDEIGKDDIVGKYDVFLSANTLKRFQWLGMDKFCSLFDYKKPFHKIMDKTYAILTNDEHKYLYDHSNRSIVASTDVKTMDLWNLGRREFLGGPLNCQLVVTLTSVEMEECLPETIKRVKEALLKDLGVPLEFDRVVNLYFQRNAGVVPIQEFHPGLLESGGNGTIVAHPIHKFMCMVLDE